MRLFPVKPGLAQTEIRLLVFEHVWPRRGLAIAVLGRSSNNVDPVELTGGGELGLTGYCPGPGLG